MTRKSGVKFNSSTSYPKGNHGGLNIMDKPASNDERNMKNAYVKEG